MKKIFKTTTMALAISALSLTAIAFAACDKHEHTYGDAVWTWASDYSSATAAFTCTSNDDTQTVNATVTSSTTAATCTADGKIVYTASAKFNDVTYTSTQTVTISKTGHTYGEAVWTWAADYSTASAAFTCTSGDDTQTVNATITSETTPATCTADGKTVYTATATFNGTTYTDTKEEVIAATDHTYGTALVYSEGAWYKTCTTCSGTLDKGTVAVTENYSDYTFLADSSAALASALSIGGNIQLTADISGDTAYTVASGTTAVLELNGKTITLSQDKSINVSGALTIAEAGDGCITIADGVTATSLFIVDGGTLTLNGGKYNNSTYYGVYCLNGGKAIVNDGAIAASQYGALSGNNTTGDMNFEVNGGTISAASGPAIYMPGQGTLTVTGGTINGGISLRMGIVNISGGTINSIQTGIDSIATYYNYSGNVWLADAIFVMAGTYTSTNATYGNKLELNITGGTINCLNDQGSAVAIYDLGKVEQTVNVTISGGTLTTNSTTRSAYQVLSLADMGVTDSNYGTYSGGVTSNVTVAISAGTAEALTAALSSGAKNIVLSADIELTSDQFIGNTFTETSTTALNMTIDVAGHTLTINKDTTTNGTSIKLYNNKNLTFKDSTNTEGSSSTSTGLVLNNRANDTEASCIFVGAGCTLTLNNIVVESVGCTLYVAGTAADINVINSKVVTTGSYVIGTNAATVDNYGVIITVDKSYLEAKEDNGWSCVVLINVDGTLNITDSTIVGQMQGVAVRAGTATITNTTITCTMKESDITDNMIAYTNMTKTWGSSPNTAIGAIVVGNVTSNTYKADSTLTLSGCTISYTITDDTSNDYSQYAVALYLVRTNSTEYKTEVTLTDTNNLTGYVINITGGSDYTSTLTGYTGTIYDTWSNNAWTTSAANSGN